MEVLNLERIRPHLGGIETRPHLKNINPHPKNINYLPKKDIEKIKLRIKIEIFYN